MEKKAPQEIHRRLRSFGRLANHMSKPEQDALEMALTPYLYHAKEPLPRNQKICVEIGLGNGELMATRAANDPHTFFIGNEVYKNGLKVLLRELKGNSNTLNNIRIHAEDGRDLLTSLPEKSIDELLVLYPDPWPKNKHKKRRIINTEFLKLADRVLKEDGTLFLATDIPDYALWMLREIYTEGTFFPTAISPEQWSTPPSWWHRTKYERKALAQGRKPWYMTYQKNVDRSHTKCAPDSTPS